MIKYFGYVDISEEEGDFVESAGVGSFDTDEIKHKDIQPYEDFLNGAENLKSYMIEVPTEKIYFSIDNIDKSQRKFDTTEAVGLGWMIALGDMYDNISDAWKAVYNKKEYVFREIFERQIH